MGRGRLTYNKSDEHCSTDFLSRLADQMVQRHRRFPVLAIFRNLLIDKDSAQFVVMSDFLPRVANFLYPDNPLEGLEGEDLESAKALQKAMHPMILANGVGMTANNGIREKAAECLFIMSQTRDAREAMRKVGIHEVLRAWHLREND